MIKQIIPAVDWYVVLTENNQEVLYPVICWALHNNDGDGPDDVVGLFSKPGYVELLFPTDYSEQFKEYRLLGVGQVEG